MGVVRVQEALCEALFDWCSLGGMLDIFATGKGLALGVDWTQRLSRRLGRLRGDRRREVSALSEILGGNPYELAKYYVELKCQKRNPADHDEEEPWENPPQPIRDYLNLILGEPEKGFKEQDGRQVLFFLADAGMGKTALLVMLKLTHLTKFWPRGLRFELLKIGPTTLQEIQAIEDRPSTVLLLDALDEDQQAVGGFDERVRGLL